MHIYNLLFSFFLQVFLLIQSEKIKNDFVYLSWLARCCESLYSQQNTDPPLLHQSWQSAFLIECNVVGGFRTLKVKSCALIIVWVVIAPFICLASLSSYSFNAVMVPSMQFCPNQQTFFFSVVCSVAWVRISRLERLH